MIHVEVPSESSFAPEIMDQWFSDTISALEAHHFMFENNVATDEMKKLYAPFINGNMDEIQSQARNATSVHFIIKTLNQYVQELRNRQVKLNQLAFDLSRSKVLVWAEVADDDESTINQLILAEAKTNAESYNSEFNISTTVVEESDNIRVPPHYHVVNLFRH